MIMCPACGGETICLETRNSPNGYVRRRRQCSACAGKVTTAEFVVANNRGHGGLVLVRQHDLNALTKAVKSLTDSAVPISESTAEQVTP